MKRLIAHLFRDHAVLSQLELGSWGHVVEIFVRFSEPDTNRKIFELDHRQEPAAPTTNGCVRSQLPSEAPNACPTFRWRRSRNNARAARSASRTERNSWPSSLLKIWSEQKKR
jgi:hypothetical protein